jgi:hypothetical protein
MCLGLQTVHPRPRFGTRKWYPHPLLPHRPYPETKKPAMCAVTNPKMDPRTGPEGGSDALRGL